MRLPDFLIIGGMRCGSTTLANILKTQDSIYLPQAKELHYFDQRNPSLKSLNQYSEQFSSALESQLICEATPDYFSTKGCMEQIHAALPNAKLILILRNPVKRAWSHYRFSVASMREIEPFANALQLEEERLAHPIHEHDIYFSYQQRGRYVEHIEHYLSKFDLSQLHIVFLEEMNADPQPVMQELFSFLQINPDDCWRNALRITNQASLVNIQDKDDLVSEKKRKLAINRVTAKVLNSRALNILPLGLRNKVYRKIESAIDPLNILNEDAINSLNDYFEPYNQRLEDVLGRKLPW